MITWSVGLNYFILQIFLFTYNKHYNAHVNTWSSNKVSKSCLKALRFIFQQIDRFFVVNSFSLCNIIRCFCIHHSFYHLIDVDLVSFLKNVIHGWYVICYPNSNDFNRWTQSRMFWVYNKLIILNFEGN